MISQKAGHIAAEAGAIDRAKESIADYVWGLRLTTAFAVGLAGALCRQAVDQFQCFLRNGD